MISKKMALGFAMLLLAGCSNDLPTKAISGQANRNGIINGTKSESSSVAGLSTVALFDGGVFCSGFIASEDIVITATHCVEDYTDRRSLGRLKVRLGTDIEAFDSQNLFVEVEDVVTHSSYRRIARSDDRAITIFNDVAVVKLKSKIPAPFKPVDIIDSDLKLPDGANILLAGWGYTKCNSIDDDLETLQEITVKLEGYWSTHLLMNQLDSNGATNGDSGGPAFAFDNDGSAVVVGITRGPLQPYKGCYNFVEYTNLAIHKDFIVKSIEALRGAPATFVKPSIATPHKFDLTPPTDFNTELGSLTHN